MSRSIRISDDLWEKLKTRSVQLRTTLQSVVEDAAERYLSATVVMREMTGGTYRPGDTFVIGAPVAVERGSVVVPATGYPEDPSREKTNGAAREGGSVARGTSEVAPDPSASGGSGERAGKAVDPKTVSARLGSSASVGPVEDPLRDFLRADQGMPSDSTKSLARAFDDALGVPQVTISDLMETEFNHVESGPDRKDTPVHKEMARAIRQHLPQQVCVCGHTQAAHRNLTGRCDYQGHCPQGCRGFVAREEPT